MVDIPDEVWTAFQRSQEATQSREAEEARRAELEKEIRSAARLKDLEEKFKKIEDTSQAHDRLLVEIKTTNTIFKWILGFVVTAILSIFTSIFFAFNSGMLHPPGS